MNSSIEPTVSISLTFKRAADALDFYSKAFGAVELFRMSPAEGIVPHAEFMIGNTHMLMSDESPMWQASAMPEGTMASCLFAINVDNVDEAFAKAIESFRMVPRAFILPLAIILPPLEVLAGALWIVNRASVAAATTILGLCALFAVALGAAILRGLPTSCGCFGAALDGSSPKVALLRDIFFTAATVYWLVLHRCAPRKARAV